MNESTRNPRSSGVRRCRSVELGQFTLQQLAILTFREFAEAGVLPNNEALHAATEKFSPNGLYGQWFSVVMVGVCTIWLVAAWLIDRFRATHESGVGLSEA